jgi:catechol 2,3-dioxygenase-like lactoylglutathione lyase family enzyme
MATNYPINPRVRAFGKARIDISRRANNREVWQKLWKQPVHAFPFAWGDCWKQCIEYKVDDFAAEVGFYIDVLGLTINAFDPDYAMFTSPHGDFYFAVVPAPEGESTPPSALRLQFMVADIFNTTIELENRGIVFEQPPSPVHPDSMLHIAYFRTPNGIFVDLWGIVQPSDPVQGADPYNQEKDEVLLPGSQDDEDETDKTEAEDADVEDDKNIEYVDIDSV